VRADSGTPLLDRDDWDRHWDAYATAAAVNPAQEFRRRLILKLLTGVDAASRIVDIGSGTGDLAAQLRRALPEGQLLGLELSRKGVELSHEKVPGATFVQWDLLRAQEPPDAYRDWATHAVCSEVLEHVDDPVLLLRNASRFLAPGCLLVVTVPGGPITRFDEHIGHRRHFSADDLGEVLADAGFDVVRASGAGFPVFNAYRLLMRALGDRLVDCAASETPPSAAARGAGTVFDRLLRMNTRLSARGWQIVAVARRELRLDP
jgi:SAM-dependent methyltransferase